MYKESKERMRVKLSYTAQVEEVLPEAAYLLKNLGDTINQIIKNYNELLTQLDEEKAFSTSQFFDNLDAVRQSLGKVDYRLLEVGEIVSGYEKYKAQQRLEGLHEERSPQIAEEEALEPEEEAGE